MAATPSLPRARRVSTLAAILMAGVLALSLAAPAQAGSDEGYLGIYLQDLDAALAAALDLDSADGVLVKDVVEDSPAEKAGLQTGDVVLSVDGRSADDVGSFTRRIRGFEPGDTVELAVLRKGKNKKIEVELGEAENTFTLRGDHGEGPHRLFFGDDGDVQVFGDDDGEFDIEVFGEGDGDGEKVIVRGLHPRPSLGVTVHDFDENLGKYFGADSGVLVLGVTEDSAAAKAGLQSGDVITSVAGESIEEIADLFNVLEDHDEGDEVAVEVLRDKTSKNFAVELDAGNGFDFARGGNSFFPRRSMHGGNHFEWRSAPRAPRVLERLHEGQGERKRLREHRELLREDRGDLREELDDLREELRALREQLEEEGSR